MNTPTVMPHDPRLTETCKESKHPQICQHCGGSHVPGLGNGLMRLIPSRWQECDHNDKPEPRILVLCPKCSRQLIEPHIRLYIRLDENNPWPGCMAICIDCKFRDGTSCTHPNAKANGGPGVMLTIGKPTHAMVDGAKYRGPVTLWPSPASACKQKEPLQTATKGENQNS